MWLNYPIHGQNVICTSAFAGNPLRKTTFGKNWLIFYATTVNWPTQFTFRLTNLMQAVGAATLLNKNRGTGYARIPYAVIFRLWVSGIRKQTRSDTAAQAVTYQ